MEVKPEGGDLIISGRIAGNSRPWNQIINIPVLQEPPDPDGLQPTDIPIGALFGRDAIEDAEIEFAATGDSSGYRRQIESLGLRHCISSSMTSLIAISEDVTVDPRDPRRRERLPVEVPAGR